jgi:hypothetical protein
MFEIGEIILCCEDYKLPHTREEINKNMPNWVKKGEKYTVRGFNDNNGIVIGILLEEIFNPQLYFKLIDKVQEGAFRTDRFVKLQGDEVTVNVEEEVIIN